MSSDRAGDSTDRAPRSLLWAGRESGSSRQTSRSSQPVQPVLGPEAFRRREFILTGPPRSRKFRIRVR